MFLHCVTGVLKFFAFILWDLFYFLDIWITILYRIFTVPQEYQNSRNGFLTHFPF